MALNINPHKLFAVDPEIKCGLTDPPQLQQYRLSYYVLTMISNQIVSI